MTQAIATIIVTCVENKWMRQTFESLEPCRNVDVIVLSKVDLEIPEFVKKVIKTSCFATTYNELLETIETPYTLFMHEGDAISTQFVEHCAYVLEGVTSLRPSIKKWKHKYYKLRPSERDVKDAPFIAPKSYCISPLLNKAKKQHNLSSNYIQGVYGIDITNDDFALHTSLAGTLIRTHILKQYRFNPDIYFEYEMDVLLRMLMDYSYYIVTDEAEFHYFDPRENDALFHIPAHYPQWYHDSIKNYLLPLIKDYVEKPKTNIFLQNYIVYYLMCRLLTNLDNRNKKQINDENRDEYLSLIQQILSYVSDSVLLNEVNLSYQTSNPELKLLLLRLKNLNQPIQYDYIEEVNDKNETDLVMKYNDVPISNLGKHRFVINVMNYIDGRIELDGSLISIFQYGGIDYYAKFEDEYVKVEDTDAYSLTKYFGVPAYRRLTYHLSFPLKDKDIQRISFYVKYQGKMYPMKMDFGNHWAKLSKSPRYSYWKFNKYFAHHGDNAIVIRKANFFNIFKREIQFQLNLIKIDKKESFKALRFRWLYWLTRPYFKNKKIWLMLDKLYKGGDSAEYLYRYSAKLNDGVTRYYLINENTKEYAELKKDGYKPLKNGSLMHKLVFLNADLILITNSHLFPFNGYTKATSKYIRGLCNFTSMCLQHGLTVQKCAMAQRRIIDNTTGYFLASRFEEANLNHHAYGYKGFNYLHVSGIARYDGLKNNDQKQILLSPTWRMYNALPVVTSEGEQRGYNPDFKNSTYFHVYNNLINHERLIETAKKYGYKIKFLLHPILSSQVDDFTPNPELEVIPSVGDLSYEKILTESSLMVTDYSGVQFDFAYMRKPIVYFHPEELPPHYDDGIFFYDTMGFGEICTKTEELVDTLCEYMKNECQMKEEYVQRADNFFEYRDHNNCKRIYDQIMEFQAKIDKDKMR